MPSYTRATLPFKNFNTDGDALVTGGVLDCLEALRDERLDMSLRLSLMVMRLLIFFKKSPVVAGLRRDDRQKNMQHCTTSTTNEHHK